MVTNRKEIRNALVSAVRRLLFVDEIVKDGIGEIAIAYLINN